MLFMVFDLTHLNLKMQITPRDTPVQDAPPQAQADAQESLPQLDQPRVQTTSRIVKP